MYRLLDTDRLCNEHDPVTTEALLAAQDYAWRHLNNEEREFLDTRSDIEP